MSQLFRTQHCCLHQHTQPGNFSRSLIKYNITNIWIQNYQSYYLFKIKCIYTIIQLKFYENRLQVSGVNSPENVWIMRLFKKMLIWSWQLTEKRWNKKLQFVTSCIWLWRPKTNCFFTNVVSLLLLYFTRLHGPKAYAKN